MSFQMGEQHLDFLSPFSASFILPGVFQFPDRLAGILIHMPGDGSERRVGAGLSDRAGSTGFLSPRSSS